VSRVLIYEAQRLPVPFVRRFALSFSLDILACFMVEVCIKSGRIMELSLGGFSTVSSFNQQQNVAEAL
jgi:hypothetical protein